MKELSCKSTAINRVWNFYRMVNNTAKDACKKKEKCLLNYVKSNHDCAYNYFVSVLLTSDDLNKYVAMANKRTTISNIIR